MLLDILILALGIAFILMSVQSFMDPDRRKVSSEIMRSTLLGVAGLFLVYLYQTNTSANKGSSGAGYYSSAYPSS